MVIEVAVRRRSTDEAPTVSSNRPWSDDAAYRLAAVVLADPVVALAHRTPDLTIDALAARLQPLVAWARRTQSLTDAEAIRRGVIAGRTRSLLGVPRRVTLVALHELPATMRRETPTPRRLDGLAIEVGLRIRRQTRRPARPERPERPAAA